ncbi:TPA: hypothetical protein JLF00_004557 [Escherichia coli]|nr:hypothetical protein [Escherichia coli]HAV9125952.1 hypothetical protein [Escherichia coli]
MKDYLQTVTGPVAREDMGLTLPHEHLFNDLSSVVDAPGLTAASLNHAEYQRRALPVKRET